MFRLLLSALFMFFLPGFTLINAIYPGRGELSDELDMLYRIVYSIGMSVALVVIIGFVLGNVFEGFVGRNLWLSLVSLTVVFFFIGWYRGAYQSLSFVSSRSTRVEPEIEKQIDEDAKKVKRLQELARRRAALKEDIKEFKDENREGLERELEKVEKRLRELEKDREQDF